MASFSTFLSTPPKTYQKPLFTRPGFHFTCPFSHVPKQYSHAPSKRLNHFTTLFTTKASAATPKQTSNASKSDERVQKVHSIQEFDDALQAAKNRLVVVEFAARNSEESSQIYPFMVDLSRTCNDVEFILVMEDESEATRELCKREKIEKVLDSTIRKYSRRTFI